ncbi:FAD-binding oxidoreductase [Rhodococcus rhodochrous]|uniref:FAD-binding oxidoreductase n=1 Tax=Rhodococcus rhodochrous TaxID=1829 RepID=UPI001E59D34A|nr:FAD-linked oxidase C-terminal domain-containing protein [Rhodococcus rhodochrous]MCD2100235.1 FAD-binding protein [Rhodococcus rhodochrous]MCD2124563.1 FAD-binding protein [Rhodococcus rhodochrous]MCQ4137607.1 FAD-binding protein [Rhodococcus rhodochrous]MDJ0021389.1 FAD-linked oxidase C-terminal domain-containing protein [Rhodococcus rhodochrous]
MSTKIVPEHLSGLLAEVSDWSTDPDELERVRTDRSGLIPDGIPDAVVRPASADEVVTVLRQASRAGIRVVTRGAGTGLSGGATATSGEIVLDVAGMNRILEIDADNATARVEPGVITADLDAAAAAHGLRYAPDPASAAISSIGGNIATNAGGLRCVKYGVTRDAVLALDVVLGDGRRLRTGRTTAKGVAGYDLTSLFVGSEGTLGVIVEATVKLSPLPVGSRTATALFDTVAEAAAAVGAVLRAGIRPSTLELLDHATLLAIDAAQGTALAQTGGAFLLVQTDGFGADHEMAQARTILRGAGARVEDAADDADAQRLLQVRRLALPSIERLGRVLIEDIAVPRTRLADAVTGIDDISRRTGVKIFTFAHAGDGNLHPIVLAAAGPADPIPAHVQDAVNEVFGLALRLGGTLTGEHGVGVLKRPWLADELGDTGLEVQRSLKTVFDPAGILNPGKAL